MFMHYYYYDAGSAAELTAATVYKRCMLQFKTGPLLWTVLSKDH